MRGKSARSEPVEPDPGAATSQAEAGLDGAPRARDAEVRLAAVGYLGAMFLGPVIPLIIYATRSRRSIRSTPSCGSTRAWSR